MTAQTRQFFQQLLPNSRKLHLDRCELDTEQQQLILSVVSTQHLAKCPICGNPSTRIHSHYERTLADLPCINFKLILTLQVSKFFCDHAGCIRRIFTERIPEIAAPWARKTVRLVQRLEAIGLALGGAAGARLSHQIGMGACGSTLLNVLEKLPLPEFEVPKILGVDDFAFRKGQQYGTILVDLERHRPISLLADRKAKTLAEWLTQHPGVEVLSRDRSATYRSGMDEGAPNAVQVADRFHLLQNLQETLEKLLNNYSSQLKAVEQQWRQDNVSTETVVVITQPTATLSAQAQSLANHRRRVEQDQEIRRLHQQQWTQRAIAQAVGVSERTVRRKLHFPELGEVSARRATFGRSILDPYKPEILAWWNDGIQETALLMVFLQQLGYTGSDRTLMRYLKQLREAQGLPPRRAPSTPRVAKVSDPQLPPFTARRASFLIVKPEQHRDAEEADLLARLVAAHPDLKQAVELAQEFSQLLRQRKAEGFDPWLMKAFKSTLKSFQAFAKGLFEDYAAVRASMVLEVSNGMVEGFNNRLKMVKRQMYGRAGLELLSKRFIVA
ncbi:MAG: ISL3 family transposase [Oscillatoriophycideae cyanobacterium NC_groundwater_1537_Pr4_S-0.65um_50_18]|nr:ISL3 family transposase [Oscillatoriophycideae cyanobacterium NC_groundwater_1537_Pr4_S-0.65um_50_18]